MKIEKSNPESKIIFENLNSYTFAEFIDKGYTILQVLYIGEGNLIIEYLEN